MEQSLKILHLEDNSADSYLIQRELKKAKLDFTLHLVDTREQFIDALTNYKPDLILSDHSLPQFDSMEALQIYKDLHCEIPFILITGSVSEEFATRSIKAGADDYILKSNLIRLPSAIAQALKARKVEAEKRKASSELEQINKELSTFIYKAAHDLRGPVCSIQGLVNVAGMQTDPNALPDVIHKISESTNKLDSILLSLMEVMSIKNMIPDIKEINFNQLLQNILERLKLVDGFSKVDFELRVNYEGAFYSDENILNAILFNISENAIKFRNSAHSKPRASISISNTGNGIEMRIEDNGIGMNKEVQEKIFDMYYKGNQFSKNTGLGLYVAQHGARKLGGTISVESNPGAGSVFVVTLPAHLVYMS